MLIFPSDVNAIFLKSFLPDVEVCELSAGNLQCVGSKYSTWTINRETNLETIGEVSAGKTKAINEKEEINKVTIRATVMIVLTVAV